MNPCQHINDAAPPCTCPLRMDYLDSKHLFDCSIFFIRKKKYTAIHYELKESKISNLK